MKLCLFSSPILILLLAPCAEAQQMSQGVDEIGRVMRDTASVPVVSVVSDKGNAGASKLPVASRTGVSFKQQLMHQIELDEAFVRQVESAHYTDGRLAKIYVQLGLLYENAAMWDRSETSLEHAVSLFRHGSESSGDLASALSDLGSLHVVVGKLRESEKEEQEALKLRENLGNALQIARSWSDLATLYLAQHKLAKAKDFARQAVDEFAVNGRADPSDKISARYALALAFCATKDCPSAVSPLKEAIDEAKVTFGPHDFPLGLGYFLLGYAYWKSGDLIEAGEYMKQGTVILDEQLGWGHPTYLVALRQYAKFLRESRRPDDAEAVERRIRQAEAVVDVHSIQAGQGSFGLAGLR